MAKGNPQASKDTFLRRQAELKSEGGVFEQTDQDHHRPMSKTSKYDLNNMTDDTRQKNHLYSDINGQGGRQAEITSPHKRANKDLTLTSNSWANTDTKAQIKKDYTGYNTKTQKHGQ